MAKHGGVLAKVSAIYQCNIRVTWLTASCLSTVAFCPLCRMMLSK